MERPCLAAALAVADRAASSRTGPRSRRGLRHDRRGATALEFALLAALTTVPLAFAAGSLGAAMQASFGKLSQSFERGVGGVGHPDTLSFAQCRIEPAELEAGVRGGEPPPPGGRDAGGASSSGGVSSASPGRYVTLRCRVAAHALPAERTALL